MVPIVSSHLCRSVSSLAAASCRPRGPSREVWGTRYGVRSMEAGIPGMDRPTRAISAGEHAVGRDGIRMVLEREAGEFDVVAEAADVPSTIKEVREHKPDLFTLDL